MRRRTRARAALFVVLATGFALVSSLTVAQTKPRTGHGTTRKPKGDAGAVTDAAADLASTGKGELAVPLRDGGGGRADGGREVVESKTLDGGGKVFRFGEVEVEGRLKSPQLVYFLRRVRAEFAAGDLGHRSFLREMSDTRHDPSF